MPIDKEKMAKDLFGQTEAACCVCCKRSVDESKFSDALNLEEWHISHMCQQCQDGTFAVLNTDQDGHLLALARSEGVMTGTTLFFGKGQDIDIILTHRQMSERLPVIFATLMRSQPIENDYGIVLINYHIETLSGNLFNILIMEDGRAASFVYANAKFLEFMDQNPVKVKALKVDKEYRVNTFREYREAYMENPVCIACDKTPEPGSLFCFSCNHANQQLEDINDQKQTGQT